MRDDQKPGTKTEIKIRAVRGSQGSAGAHEGWAPDKGPMAKRMKIPHRQETLPPNFRRQRN